ncbi:MAG TPA: c-type cytochrome [Chitinophagaceae bacterium]
MITRQQFITLSVIFLLVISGIAATRLPQYKARNLKVLPKDISDEKLDSIMHTYNKALGVNCAFCHTPYNKNLPDSLNYEVDENPMKEDARKMMRLTIQINKDYFYYDTLQRPEYLKVVTCFTCHRGDPFPADLK